MSEPDPGEIPLEEEGISTWVMWVIVAGLMLFFIGLYVWAVVWA